jgi:hypothetical protein
MHLKKQANIKLASSLGVAFLVVSCMKMPRSSQPVLIKEDPAKALSNAKEIREKTPAKLADGLQMTLWASDSLAPDPVAMSIDDKGRVYINRTNRQKKLGI